jgi:hypothetical protein
VLNASQFRIAKKKAGLGEGSPEPLASRNSILPLGPLGMLTKLITRRYEWSVHFGRG